MTEMPAAKNARPKTKNVKLASKSLDKALKEVARRGLDKFEKFENNAKGKKVSSPKAKQAA